MEILNERPYNCKRQWKRIFIKCLDHPEKEIARFTSWDDAAQFVQHRKEADQKSNYITALYIR